MLFTTRQPYISWKGTSTKSAVPTLNRPNVNVGHYFNNDNVASESTARDYIGIPPPTGRYVGAKPIKHWRRQLNPQSQSGFSGARVANMERPGGSVVINGNCCDLSGGDIITNPFLKWANNTIQTPVPSDKIQNNGFIQVGGPLIDNSYNIQTGIYNTKCIACNPENNVIKSGVSLLSKAYYSDTVGYLQSRCKRWIQKLTIEKQAGVTYIASDGSSLWPNDNSTGPQNFNTGDCPKGCSPTSSNTVTTIYKPSNRPFSHQGAVSNSTRLVKLKYDTITRNGNSFRSAWGAQGANAGKYQGTTNSPYFVKSKNQACIPNLRNRRNGDHTFCFVTPTGSLVNQNKTTTMVYTR